MNVYVVVDTKGSGRILAVFDNEAKANRIVSRYPRYYKLHPCELNRINPGVLGWVDDEEQRKFLAKLVKEQG